MLHKRRKLFKSEIDFWIGWVNDDERVVKKSNNNIIDDFVGQSRGLWDFPEKLFSFSLILRKFFHRSLDNALLFTLYCNAILRSLTTTTYVQTSDKVLNFKVSSWFFALQKFHSTNEIHSTFVSHEFRKSYLFAISRNTIHARYLLEVSWDKLFIDNFTFVLFPTSLLFIVNPLKTATRRELWSIQLEHRRVVRKKFSFFFLLFFV